MDSENKIEKYTLRKRIFGGIAIGLFYAVLMAGYDYYTDIPFSLPKFLFHSFIFGLLMSFVLKYKVTKKKD